jgi:hypothetical protein
MENKTATFTSLWASLELAGHMLSIAAGTREGLRISVGSFPEASALEVHFKTHR